MSHVPVSPPARCSPASSTSGSNDGSPASSSSASPVLVEADASPPPPTISLSAATVGRKARLSPDVDDVGPYGGNSANMLAAGLRSGSSSPALRRVALSPASSPRVGGPSPRPSSLSSHAHSALSSLLPHPTSARKKDDDLLDSGGGGSSVCSPTPSRLRRLGWITVGLMVALLLCVNLYHTMRFTANLARTAVVPASEMEQQTGQTMQLAVAEPLSCPPCPTCASCPSCPTCPTLTAPPAPAAESCEDEEEQPSGGLMTRRVKPFILPKGNSRIYITAMPNHGAGLGHQFGEWLLGPYYALRHNLTYIHTPFLIQSALWTRFLGFGEGENTMEDLQFNFPGDRLRVVTRGAQKFRRDYLQRHSEDEWIRARVAEMEAELEEDQVGLLRYDLVPTPEPRWVCDAEINLLLRRKYCAARVAHPLRQDLYAADRAAGRVIVAVHYRCGDSCLDYKYRATPFDSTAETMASIARTLTEELGGARDRLAFHFFAQPPRNLPKEYANLTAETHFARLFADPRLEGLSIQSHFDTTSFSTLHHLASADVLFGAQSSFSWLANLLHHGVSIGPTDACKNQIRYSKHSGAIDEDALRVAFRETRQSAGTRKFQSMQDCMALTV